ncbi:MAG: methyl-accepting chemotaxis protein [Plesiomonas sp.]
MLLNTKQKYAIIYIAFSISIFISIAIGALKVKSSIQEDNITRLENLISNAKNTVIFFEKKAQIGEFNEETAKKLAQDTLQSYVYSDDEYIWATDENLIFVAAPLDPNIINKSFADIINKEAAVQIRNNTDNAKGKVVTYIWQSTNGNVTTDIKSMAVKTPGWGWYLGSGVQDKKVNDIFYAFLRQALFLGVIVNLFIGFVIWKVIKSHEKILGSEPEKILILIDQIAKGNLSNALNSKDDEVGIYARVLDMAKSLKSLINEIKLITQELKDASCDLNSSAQLMNNKARMQTGQLAQTSEAMSQIVLNVNNIADSASQASEAATHVDESSTICLDTINAANNDMNQLASDIGEVTQAIASLKCETENIGGILDEIRSIADQTNLLALNAAIEAARAGESGRGFAVVADEVRTLANRTQGSTNKISTMLNLLQGEAYSSMQIMKNNSDEANHTAEKTSDTQKIVHSISESASIIQSINNQIAVATQQQLSSTSEVRKLIIDINETAQSNIDTVDQVTKQSTNLGHMADNLSTIVDRFQL